MRSNRLRHELAESHSTVDRNEHYSLATARRVAVMLGIDPDSLHEGDQLPRGWHFPLLAGETPRSLLRADGFPGLGIPMPELDLARLVLSRRTVHFAGDVMIGSTVRRTSTIRSITHKGTADAPFALVEIDHELAAAETGQLLVNEQQTYALLPANDGKREDMPRPPSDREPGDNERVVTPDATLLFQYSALCFNSHRIHIDRDYARNVEGYPDLVVNGGLTTLLATEFIRTTLRATISSLRLRYVGPLFCGQPLSVAINTVSTPWVIQVTDANGAPAAIGDATV
jgi:3-methylfumaryl-CoA hydratase